MLVLHSKLKCPSIFWLSLSKPAFQFSSATEHLHWSSLYTDSDRVGSSSNLKVKKMRSMMWLLSKPMGVLQHGKAEGGHVYVPGPLNMFKWVRSSECKWISGLLFSLTCTQSLPQAHKKKEWSEIRLCNWTSLMTEKVDLKCVCASQNYLILILQCLMEILCGILSTAL